MSSKELTRWLRSWVKGYGHTFCPANFGISAAVCPRCGLVVTARGRIFSDSNVWLVRTWGSRLDRLMERDLPVPPGYPPPHLLRLAVLSVLPKCGIPIVLSVMGA